MEIDNKRPVDGAWFEQMNNNQELETVDLPIKLEPGELSTGFTSLGLPTAFEPLLELFTTAPQGSIHRARYIVEDGAGNRYTGNWFKFPIQVNEQERAKWSSAAPM